MNEILIFLIISIVVLIFLYISKYRAYTLASGYYVIFFLLNTLLPDLQVRFVAISQVTYLVLCILIISFFRISSINSCTITIKYYDLFFFSIIMIIIYGFFYGMMQGNGIFAIAVDSYKYLEIFLLFLFFKIIWNTKESFDKGFKNLFYTMIIIGIIEMFTTERGGIAVNILFSSTPIFILLNTFQGKKVKWIYILLFFIILISTKTRTYWIGFTISIGCMYLFSNKINKRKLFKNMFYIAIFLLVGIIILYNVYSEYIIEILTRLLALSGGFDKVGGYRLSEIKVALEFIKRQPLFGYGFGFQKYVFIPKMGYFLWGDFMHNVYVEIALKIGIIGFIFLSIFVYYGIHSIRKRTFNSSNKAINAFGVASLSTTIGWFVIYFAAPMSSYGYVFLPLIFTSIFLTNERKEM